MEDQDIIDGCTAMIGPNATEEQKRVVREYCEELQERRRVAEIHMEEDED